MSPLEVIAAAARTPVGLCAESTAAAVRCGLTRAGEFPFVSETGEPVIVHFDASLPTGLEGRERIVPLVESVLDEVSGKLPPYDPHRTRCHLLLVLPEARPGFSDDDAAWVVDTLRQRLRLGSSEQGPLDASVALAARGHAGTLLAIQAAVQHGAAEPDALFLVVGADSYHHPETFIWLEHNRQFAGPTVRSGFVPGEGAGCLALASTALRRRSNVPCLAQIRGVGTARETLLRGSETGSFGIGMTQAVLTAMTELAVPQETPDATYCDINGERYRSEEWGFVALRAPQAFRTLQYRAPADCLGDVGAAFGTLAANLAIQAFARGYAEGPRALVMAGSESGLRGALILQDPAVTIGAT